MEKEKTEEGKKIKTIQITHKSNTMKRNTNNKIAEREREREKEMNLCGHWKR